MNKPQLRLYGRLYCHLCEEMLGVLRPLQEELGLGLEIVDIDEDPLLQARYNTLVPVLVALDGSEFGQEICHYHLDEAALRRQFSSHPPN